MNPRVRNVEPLGEYRLKSTFTNGEVSTYDCRPLLDFGVSQEWRDEACFRQVRPEGRTVIWPHEQDVCPDTLYLDAEREPGRARCPRCLARSACSSGPRRGRLPAP